MSLAFTAVNPSDLTSRPILTHSHHETYNLPRLCTSIIANRVKPWKKCAEKRFNGDLTALSSVAEGANVDETPEHYLDTIASAAKKAELKHVLFGGPGVDLIDGDPARRVSLLKKTKRR